MGIVIGMDEAGYGPNLGPLVVTATVWEVPGSPRTFDWWDAFAAVLTNEPRRRDDRLHVADSKAVYSPARGLGSLERSVLALLRVCDDDCPNCFGRLRDRLTDAVTDVAADGPWFDGHELPLPRVDANGTAERDHERLASAFRDHGVRLRAIRSEVVQPKRFNALLERDGNKAAALSRISAGLLRSVWNPDGGDETYVVCDKHGGRNRYDPVLADVLDGHMIQRLDEGRERSRYRVGRTEIVFRTQAESQLPVAVASMVSKYVRELSMELFNAFWAEHVPGVKPTKGYPVDAARFRDDVAEKRRELGIADTVFWRSR